MLWGQPSIRSSGFYGAHEQKRLSLGKQHWKIMIASGLSTVWYRKDGFLWNKVQSCWLPIKEDTMPKLQVPFLSPAHHTHGYYLAVFALFCAAQELVFWSFLVLWGVKFFFFIYQLYVFGQHPWNWSMLAWWFTHVVRYRPLTVLDSLCIRTLGWGWGWEPVFMIQWPNSSFGTLTPEGLVSLRIHHGSLLGTCFSLFMSVARKPSAASLLACMVSASLNAFC